MSARATSGVLAATTQRQLDAPTQWSIICGNHPTAQVTITAGDQETIANETGIVGDSLTEAKLLLAIKGTRQYKQVASQARTKAKGATSQAAQDYHQDLKTLENIDELALVPRDLAWYQSSIDEVQSWHMGPRPSTSPNPP